MSTYSKEVKGTLVASFVVQDVMSRGHWVQADPQPEESWTLTVKGVPAARKALNGCIKARNEWWHGEES